jgi:hypothetical protein
MAKKTKAELVEEGKVLGSTIADIRKTPHGFALLIGSDAVHLAVHKTKSTAALRNEAKAAGGNAAKGALGTVEMDGKTLMFTCAEGEAPPSTLGKKFKAHLKERGLSFKVVILGSDGTTLEGDEEDDLPPEGGSASPVEEGAQKDLRSKLEDAFAKFAPMLKKELGARDPSQQAPILKAIKLFKDAMAKEDYADALKKLNNLRTGLISVAKPSQIDAGTTPQGKVDKEALLEKAGQVDTVVKKALGERDFFVKSAPRLRELRKSFKLAMADNPSEEELAKLKKMKGKLDDLFLADLAYQGHGPQRHEGAVTTKQLTDRAVSGFDPLTGTQVDGVQGGEHRCGRHATRFTDPGDYVDAEERIRADPRTTAAKNQAVKEKKGRFSVEVGLEEAMGLGFEAKLEGVSRKGSLKNPAGSEATDFSDGFMTAVYDIEPDGSYTLVTMYPNPKPPPPPPPKAPRATPKKKRNRKRR